ncbi:Desulfoferrodoxin ferrous iron-binding region [Coriobacterium glomerans PW2]|uniref:Desulfoferrodoxin ferrous iron-binding region n=1 Tax=Coriobacterium glomerans (strain ATCC 49209 / DSM 20642 / JCM 10262 / PW2) TaxID=700015 RepID=F2N887_CORGP|nr:desulfoferrodoxin family protein [Coriobacterium glomerans]AEB07270.1 Desulfoferrodoxin ferrous iron-binding region [Coriobacterium glomerans PW2]
MADFFKDSEGNIFVSLKTDAPTPEGFNKLDVNTVDAVKEKHVPVVEMQRDGHIIHVQIGEVEHPMIEEHHIEWIALVTPDRLEIHELKPGQSPTTFFAGGAKSGTVYEHCNIHGLWKADF